MAPRDDDKESFAALYASTRPRLLAYALRRTSSPEDAADVVAEVFTIAWRRHTEVPNGESALLWLYAVARRVLANQVRRSLHRSKVIERLRTEASRIVGESNPSSENALTARLLLAKMSEDDREILTLVGWEGLDSASVAYVLDCSPIAARIRLHRARIRLAAAMSDEGVHSKHTLPLRHIPLESQMSATTSETDEGIGTK